MAHDKLRESNICENCGYTVDIAYCSNCGQKNVETRQSFGHLITHFAEDLTHYDGAFWKTMKYLLFYPGRLTNEYLSGKRQKFVPPVKLYIFISFVTFLIVSLSFHSEHEGNISQEERAHMVKNHITTKQTIDSLYFPTVAGTKVRTVEELDSLQSALPEDKRMNRFTYWIRKKEIEKNREFTNLSTDKGDFGIDFIHFIPKVLFFYMPIFVFWLWLFHSKKRWYFFDHGIYTLHFFSFILLSTTLINIPVLLAGYIFDSEMLQLILYALFFSLIIFYLFRSYYIIYKEKLLISLIKSFILTIFNTLSFISILALASLYVALTH